MTTSLTDQRASLPERVPQPPVAQGLAAFLCDRERAVLELRVNYHTHKEIMRELGIAEKTVKTHLQTARAKFGARSMGELLRLARLHGIAPPIEANFSRNSAAKCERS